MSGKRRFEDSVVVSIDQVRDMIRDETRPKPQPVPIARPVVPSTVEGVPTFAEIAARREQRWDDAPIGQAPVVRVAPKRRWKGPVFAALLGALVAGGGVFAVHAAEGDPAPFAVAATAYEEAVDNAALQAELRAAQTEAEAARVKIKQLETELEALRNAPPPTPPAVASAEPEPKKAKKSRSKRKRVSKRSKSRRSKARTKKRRPRKKTAADKQLDALLDGL